MTTRVEEHFVRELEEARRKLQELGRDVENVPREGEAEGLKCDFELPYSSLPSISGSRWQ